MYKRNRYLIIGLLIVSLLWTFSVNSEARTLSFAGRTWIVKSGYSDPGPNNWSDGKESAWVDIDGRLHLKIKKEGGIWHSAEIYTDAPTQHGIHRFYITSPIDNMDKDIVVSFSLYKDKLNGINLEFAKWGKQLLNYNAQYSVVPARKRGNLENFKITLEGLNSTHYIDWSSSRIHFKSIHGHYPEPRTPNFLIHEWVYRGTDIPDVSKNLKICIRLWLDEGRPPSNGEPFELIITHANLPHPPKTSLTFKTNPSKNPPRLKIDGKFYDTPKTFEWTIGTSHEICAPDQENYYYSHWSDGGEQDHIIKVGSSKKTFTAHFNVAAEVEGEKSILSYLNKDQYNQFNKIAISLQNILEAYVSTWKYQ